MKTRWLVDLHKIEDVKEYKDGGRDDLTEQTEIQLDRDKHYYCQIQGDSLGQIISELQYKETILSAPTILLNLPIIKP